MWQKRGGGDRQPIGRRGRSRRPGPLIPCSIEQGILIILEEFFTLGGKRLIAKSIMGLNAKEMDWRALHSGHQVCFFESLWFMSRLQLYQERFLFRAEDIKNHATIPRERAYAYYQHSQPRRRVFDRTLPRESLQPQHTARPRGSIDIKNPVPPEHVLQAKIDN